MKRLYWQLSKEKKIYTTEQMERILIKLMNKWGQDVIHYEFRIVGIDEPNHLTEERNGNGIVNMDSYDEEYDIDKET